jgi:hypothetical protein
LSILEAGMLVCFGLAWPVSIYKSFTSRTNKGKSFIFLLVVLIGYIFGILNKVFGHMDWVIWLYCLNFLMVSADAVLYIRNGRMMKQSGE